MMPGKEGFIGADLQAEDPKEPERVDADEEELIAKKEVLRATGISYGQFYRWKRLGLIPEGWFIRKSTFTGQETFLPKRKVLERIAKIKALKEQHSLEEIAELLSPELTRTGFPPEEVARMGWLSREALDYYNQVRRLRGPFRFKELFYLAVIEALRRLDLETEELDLAVATLLEHDVEPREGEPERTLLIVRKELPGLTARRLRASFCVIAERCWLDPGAQVAARLELNRVLEDLKMRVKEVL